VVPPELPPVDGGLSQPAAADAGAGVPPTVRFSSKNLARFLPPLQSQSRGRNFTTPTATSDFIKKWNNCGWGSEAARFYAECIKPYLGNAFERGDRQRAFQVCSVQTSPSTPKTASPFHSICIPPHPKNRLSIPFHFHSKLTLLRRLTHTPQPNRFPTGMKCYTPTAGATGDGAMAGVPEVFIILAPHQFHEELMRIRPVLCPNCGSPARLATTTHTPLITGSTYLHKTRATVVVDAVMVAMLLSRP